MGEGRERMLYEVVRRRALGQGLRPIARALGIDRKTVRAMIGEIEQRRNDGDDALARLTGAKRAPRGSKLDRFAGLIAELRGRYPDIRATRVHEELCARGFTGGYTIVREYLNASRPKPAPRVFQVVETAPGKQVQVDWSPYRLADGSPIHCFSAVLSYSRFLYARFCTDTRQATIFRQLRHAFDAFAGVPAEAVFDSMSGVVDRWEYEQPVLNLRAVDFAAFYDFALHIAPRGDGPYKGKVERPFRYLLESFFNGRTFHTEEQANQTLRWWLDHKANVRVHGTTGKRPIELLEQDRAALRALPAHPYDDREMAYHVVDSYGYVRFDGNCYRAKGIGVGRWVYVRAGEREVQVIDERAQVVASYPRAPRAAGQRVPPPTVREPRRPIGELLAVFERWGENAGGWARRVREIKRRAAAELGAIVEMQADYRLEDILAAIEHAGRFGAYGAAPIARILAVRASPRTAAEQVAEQARRHVRASMAAKPVLQRPLGAYAALLGATAPMPENQPTRPGRIRTEAEDDPADAGENGEKEGNDDEREDHTDCDDGDLSG